MTAAIDGAYNAIKSMQSPFRNNLTGTKVDAAIEACADLTELTEGQLLGRVPRCGRLRFYIDTDPVCRPGRNSHLQGYEGESLDALQRRCKLCKADNKSQAKVDAACAAWRAMRVPWEQSEAVLFGPAGEETGLGFDPSMDSWPLDQEDIATIITNKNLSTGRTVHRGDRQRVGSRIHTIELLLFKDGQNRKVLAE